MTARTQFYLLGNNSHLSDSLNKLSDYNCNKLENQTLESLQPDETVSLFEETSSEYVGFIERPELIDQTQLNQIKNFELKRDQTGACFLPFSSAELFTQSYEILSPIAVLLAMNPFQHAIVLIHKSTFLSLKEIPNSEDLLWHSLILMAEAGIKNQLIAAPALNVGRKLQIPLPQLAPDYPGHDRDWLLHLIRDYQPAQDLPSVSSQADAIALKAGLLCIHDYLEESHQLSQSVEHEGPHRSGDYWHHIMHRREPDYSNAKYWSRAVGHHPLHVVLPEAVEPLFDQFHSPAVANWKNQLLQSERWSLNSFVDCCAECESNQNLELNDLAQNIQWIEMQLLLQKTSLDATTG
ncbi:hypothetical protein [Gimesia aquarii]|uniref:Uncharacterized protein n=1 Tax=Gimesia aquarii TaxID=2527964 RepID=A0A517VY64_9PLAN|nr:hypothetical protein [Gimesia aquarii]QDT97935.1 hypothetical protein V144x_34180 [Gimesia aquarii]